MNFLLDTNVVSELRKVGDNKANPEVIAWLSSVDAERLYVSALTLLELELGILRIERHDPTKGGMLRNGWISESRLSFGPEPWPSMRKQRFGVPPFTCQTRSPSAMP